MSHRAVPQVVLQIAIDTSERTLRGAILENYVQPALTYLGLFYRDMEFTVGSLLIKSTTAMCKYVGRREGYLKLQSIQRGT
jgi:hypothetical protein